MRASALMLLATLAACDAPNLTPPPGPDGGGLTYDCLPNLDGTITADELPVALSVPVDFYVSPDGTPIDVAGTVDDAGRRVWDYSSESAADNRVTVMAEPTTNRWYEGSFPTGTFVLPALGHGGLDGIYSRDDTALWLHGLASPEKDPSTGQTLLVYDQPVALLRLPMTSGDMFTSVGTITNGKLDGLPYNGTDTYDVEVDGSGRLELPYITFTQALRVRTHVVVAPAAGGVTTSVRQVSFVFECFGEVARAVSRPDEPNRDFTVAAEVRRFAL